MTGPEEHRGQSIARMLVEERKRENALMQVHVRRMFMVGVCVGMIVGGLIAWMLARA